MTNNHHQEPGLQGCLCLLNNRIDKAKIAHMLELTTLKESKQSEMIVREQNLVINVKFTLPIHLFRKLSAKLMKAPTEFLLKRWTQLILAQSNTTSSQS